MRWRDELDALTFESVSRMIAGGIVLGGLVGATLVGTGTIGERSSVSAAAEPVVETKERSPVCLRVDPQEIGLSTPLEAAVVQAFPTAGDDLFSGWPQRVDGRWRWDRSTPDDSGEATSVDVGATAKDSRGVAWTSLSYDLADGPAGLTKNLRLVVPASYVGDDPPSSGLPVADDPAQIPPGGSLVLEADAFEAAGDTSTLRRLAAELPGGGGDEVAAAITPIGSDDVVVTIGTEAAVQRSAVLWPAVTDVHAEIAPDEDLPAFALRQLVLDLSSDRGRQAYASLLDGELPARTSEAVRSTSLVTGGAPATARARTLDADPVAVPPSFFAAGVERTVREDGDGVVTLTRSIDSRQGRLRFGEVFGADGRPRGIEAAIRVRDVSSAVASTYNRSFAGRPAEVSGSVNLVLTLDSEDLATIRSDSLQVAADWFNTDGDGRRFARDVLRLKGLAEADDVAAWMEQAQPALVDRIAGTMAAGGGGTPDHAAGEVLRATSADGEDPWATYVAYTGAIDDAAAGVPTALSQWGAAVQRGSRSKYAGFGDATCTSVS